jgi:hypothetical protein
MLGDCCDFVRLVSSMCKIPKKTSAGTVRLLSRVVEMVPVMGNPAPRNLCLTWSARV